MPGRAHRLCQPRLAAQGGYHVFTLTSPDRLVIDVSHVALGKFPGIWDITRIA